MSKLLLERKDIEIKTEFNPENPPNFNNGELSDPTLTTGKIPKDRGIIVSITSLLNFNLLSQTNKEIFKIPLDLHNQFQQNI